MTVTNNKLRHRVSRLPSPMAGLALAIASLGWAWESMLPSLDGIAQLIGSAIAAVLLLMLVAKFTLHPKVLIAELSHPVIGSVVPTFAMGLMVVSAAIGRYSHGFALILWFTAIVIHLIFLSMFIYNRAVDFKLSHMVPSWFVPSVGIIVAAVSFPHGELLQVQNHWIANAILNFGMLSYLIMLPIMLYRLIFCEPIPDAAKPTIAIMAAPASLSLAGYLTISEHPSIIIVGVLLTLALLMTSIIYLAFFNLLKLPFSPGYAAFTFPLVIGATALFKTVTWIITTYGENSISINLLLTAKFELIVATIIVTYVAIRYLSHYKSNIFKGNAA
ncbi:C4-dicarboxylate ABC transporter [Shewanella sp. Choline-02u-19]|jgi:exfoliative toxin A/B|uniref:TDT family transporter n=1 Tax=unclassified Shewanella TaxID=196818 RepID=UPI000C323C0D|nr:MULTISPECIES: TDT family transporter [unclassified Shewanella]PKG57824.1 C4-dicarboxylate ABC transporter [Shewanella sp. GutDb-MelDb]PKG74189.1 C4-dicarboxylate ABC transporter [Shewanella sp. GutCb]PKH55851.1 C4-dicarboxylate ABC transporter [Shewanella sp. Bg11-22]PKI27214.1 C4-dicarboxylate ABC transporter [Shewanella sp. Choline-02u-19]